MEGENWFPLAVFLGPEAVYQTFNHTKYYVATNTAKFCIKLWHRTLLDISVMSNMAYFPRVN